MSFGYRVAGFAEGYQVAKFISFLVSLYAKFTKGRNVMNVKFLPDFCFGNTASLARVTISLAGFLALFLPVRAVIEFGAFVLIVCVTLGITEVLFRILNSIRHEPQFFTAKIARLDYLGFPVRMILPPGYRGQLTWWVFGLPRINAHLTTKLAASLYLFDLIFHGRKLFATFHASAFEPSVIVMALPAAKFTPPFAYFAGYCKKCLPAVFALSLDPIKRWMFLPHLILGVPSSEAEKAAKMIFCFLNIGGALVSFFAALLTNDSGHFGFSLTRNLDFYQNGRPGVKEPSFSEWFMRPSLATMNYNISRR